MPTVVKSRNGGRVWVSDHKFDRPTEAFEAWREARRSMPLTGLRSWVPGPKEWRIATQAERVTFDADAMSPGENMEFEHV
jgi:hypothetical protein